MLPGYILGGIRDRTRSANPCRILQDFDRNNLDILNFVHDQVAETFLPSSDSFEAGLDSSTQNLKPKKPTEPIGRQELCANLYINLEIKF